MKDHEILDYQAPEIKRNPNKDLVVAGSLGAAAAAYVVSEGDAHADAVTDITGMVSSLGTLASAALTVALVPMGIAFAFRIIKKVMYN